ncbi:MAG TPA: heme-binding protein [Steroidobacteraceae bacterium]|jgi:uncharacterized protein GlcG (DUF336 family)
MPTVNLAQADQIITAALAHGRAAGMKPLTVVVLDSGGHVVALKREDNSSLMRPQIATGKAWGTLALGMGCRDIAKRAAVAPAFIGSLSDMSGGKVVPVPGGVLIKDANGQIVGAVGVTGDLSENDEACAIAGIQKAGLMADAGSV